MMMEIILPTSSQAYGWGVTRVTMVTTSLVLVTGFAKQLQYMEIQKFSCHWTLPNSIVPCVKITVMDSFAVSVNPVSLLTIMIISIASLLKPVQLLVIGLNILDLR